MSKQVNLNTYYYNKTYIDENFSDINHTHDEIPNPSTTIPVADTNLGNKGSSSNYARADHIHPKSSLYASSSHGHTTLGGVTQINASGANIPFLSVNGANIYTYDQRLLYNRTNNNIQYSKNNTYSELATMNDLPVNLSDLNDDLGVITSQNLIELASINPENEYGISVWRDGYDIITLLNDKLVYYDNIGTVTYTNSDGNTEELANLHNIQNNIVDNLTTNDATKSLSAKQGKILNDLIGDAITYINQ